MRVLEQIHGKRKQVVGAWGWGVADGERVSDRDRASGLRDEVPELDSTEAAQHCEQCASHHRAVRPETVTKCYVVYTLQLGKTQIAGRRSQSPGWGLGM